MPSPFGHVLGGVAVAWTADLVDRRPSSARFVAACGALAMLPDADLLFSGHHRVWSHSITAVVVVTIISAAVTGQVTRRWRVALTCGAAYLSHLVLDWLGADNFPPYGLQLLWPLSDRWFISGWDVFRQTAREEFFTAPIIRRNLLAFGQELAILAPIVLVIWLVRIKTLAGLAAEMPGRHHPAQ